jgi:hypothetical protein
VAVTHAPLPDPDDPPAALTGGGGTMTFDGTLSHNAFPPTIDGHITQ